jgi:phosphatidate cytidylyltransferase
MRQRSISAVGVVAVGLIPAFMGGPVFAFVLTALCLIGLNEYNRMAQLVGNRIAPTGYLAVASFGLVALLGGEEQALLGACAVAVGIPIMWILVRPDLDRAFVDWALSSTGALYLGLPLFAAIAMRQTAGATDSEWLNDLAGTLSLGWNGHARGLAWLLVVILATWLSDTGAYLIGRAAGKHPLIPRISPKKTVEGLVGGLAASAATGAIAVGVFGLGIPWWSGLIIGIIIGAIGVIGDLAESLMKRQAGVKDSGTLIPGHGGMLDRLDALLFTWPAGWFVAGLIDRWF